MEQPLRELKLEQSHMAHDPALGICPKEIKPASRRNSRAPAPCSLPPRSHDTEAPVLPGRPGGGVAPARAHCGALEKQMLPLAATRRDREDAMLRRQPTQKENHLRTPLLSDSLRSPRTQQRGG